MENSQNIERIVTAKFIGVVFLYMFMGLAITALSAGVVGYLFTRYFSINEFVGYDVIYLITLISSAVILVICSIWFSIAAYRSRIALIIPYIIYALAMGVLVSSFTMYVQFEVLALTFAVTCLSFLVMALIAIFTKKNLNFILVIVFGILLGSALISLTNVIWMLFIPIAFDYYYWIIEFAIFGVIMLITIYDIWHIKNIAERGEANNNVALYCAFNLYTDFINIFIRLLVIFANIKRKK